MKLLRAAAVAVIAAAPLFASAGLVSVFFEKTWDHANGDVNEFYNGGTAADGSSGGPNLGISFVNVSGLSNDALNTYYNKGSLGSSIGVAYAHDSAFMNMTEAAIGSFAFYYSSPAAVIGGVKIWSGLNGTGTLLGSINLAVNNTAALYDTWTFASGTFSGLARSFDFSAGAATAGFKGVAFDDIAVFSVPLPVPEPSTVLLMLVGGAALLRAKTHRVAPDSGRLRERGRPASITARSLA